MKGGGAMLFNYKDITNSLTVVLINSKEVADATARKMRIYNIITSLLSAFLVNFVNYYIYNSKNITSKFIVPIADCLKFIPADTTMSIPLLYIYKMILQLRISAEVEFGTIYEEGHHKFISSMTRPISYYHNDVLEYIYKNPSILRNPTLLDIARNIFPADFINSIRVPLRWLPVPASVPASVPAAVPAKRELRLSEPIKKPIKIDKDAWHEWNPQEAWRYDIDRDGRRISNTEAKPKIGFTVTREGYAKMIKDFILPKIDYDLLKKAVIFLLDFPLIGKYAERMECNAYHGMYHYGDYIKKYGFTRILDIQMSTEIQLADLVYYDKQYNILIGSDTMLVIDIESAEFQNKKGDYLPGELDRVPRDDKLGRHSIAHFHLSHTQSPEQEKEIRDAYKMSDTFLEENMPPFYSSINAYKQTAVYKQSPAYKQTAAYKASSEYIQSQRAPPASNYFLSIKDNSNIYIYVFKGDKQPLFVWFNKKFMAKGNNTLLKEIVSYLKRIDYNLEGKFIEYIDKMKPIVTSSAAITDNVLHDLVESDPSCIGEPSEPMSTAMSTAISTEPQLNEVSPTLEVTTPTRYVKKDLPRLTSTVRRPYYFSRRNNFRAGYKRKTIKNTSRRRTYKSTELKSRLV